MVTEAKVPEAAPPREPQPAPESKSHRQVTPENREIRRIDDISYVLRVAEWVRG
jgi:hypothetical protein